MEEQSHILLLNKTASDSVIVLARSDWWINAIDIFMLTPIYIVHCFN